MKSTIVKRAIVIGGHKTTISLDDAFWRGLKEIAHARCVTLSKVVIDIDKARRQANPSSAIRLFVLKARTHGTADSQKKHVTSFHHQPLWSMRSCRGSQALLRGVCLNNRRTARPGAAKNADGNERRDQREPDTGRGQRRGRRPGNRRYRFGKSRDP
jgi:predicted DNA-binding ribbon-helix-helix protein